MATRNGNAARHRQVELVTNGFPHEEMKAALGSRDGRAQRAAYCLDWAARKRAGKFIPYNEIVRCIDNTTSLPRMDSDEVAALRRSMTQVKNILFRKYERWATNAVNAVRATTGPDEVAAMCPRITRRIDSASGTLGRAWSLIDPKTMKDQKLKEYCERVLGPLMKQLNAPSFQKNLLPPASDEDDKE
jgi:hypothetical protein